MLRNRLIPALAAAALLAACDRHHDVIIGGPPPGAPTDLSVETHWVLEGFTNTGQSTGYPVVDVHWNPPANWSSQPFRVYARRVGDANFFLIATVTSCTANGCVYRDRNVTQGVQYEYYVATADEDTNQETTTDFREVVRVPASTTPATPQADSAVALDNAAFVRWRDGGVGGALWKYVVYLTRIDATSYLYGLGETDGLGLVDTRATNGHVYGYRVAAVDTFEHVSALSAEMTVVPRPDVRSELIYTFQTNSTQSGFRFQTSESTNPVLDGSSAQAQWRLERTGAGWQIVPLNGSSVVEYSGRTTALACGPGADADCRAATRAPTAGYQTTAILIKPEFSYILRVTGSDGQTHYGVVRADILGNDGSGHDLMIFDWAYQLVANDVRLDRVGG
ncbi:MAG TPA: hypothetical protein VF092_18920 [Longimicrobium sp.]